MIVPSTAAANSSASVDLPLAVGPAIRMTGVWAPSPVLTSARPSRRALRGLLRMRSFLDAIKKSLPHAEERAPDLLGYGRVSKHADADPTRGSEDRGAVKRGVGVDLVMTVIAGPGGAGALPD